MQAAVGQEPRRLADAAAQQMALATDKVRYVGDPVACVVAETAEQAQGRGRGGDARHRAAAGGDHGPRRRRRRARRSCTTRRPATSCSTSTTAMPRRSRRRSPAPRMSRSSRSAQQPHRRRARWSRARRSARMTRATGATCCASAARACSACAAGLQGRARACRPSKVRVLTGNVGGSFGMKASVYPEYPCLLHAARALGRPVKWTDERSESFLSDSHGRDHETRSPNWRSTRTASSWPCASPATAMSAPTSATRPPCRRPINAVKNMIGVYRDAADRGDLASACSPTPRRSAPIAAPGGPRATTTWSG